MRNMSFALTADQIVAGTKTVTRRIGWEHLQPGDQVRPVLKAMGMRKGEHVQVLTDPLTVRSVRRERLDRLLKDLDYGSAEVVAEGFPTLDPWEFVDMFLSSHKGCRQDSLVTRIEFEPR
jgi:hypothetical protein